MAFLYTPNLIEIPIINQMVGGDISLQEAIAHLASLDIDCLLVVEAGQLQGWLTTKDVVKLATEGKTGNDCALKMVMAQPPYILNPEEAKKMSLVLQYLHQYRVHQLPVVDDNNKVLGLVTAQGIIPLCHQQINYLNQLEIQIDQIVDAQTDKDYLLREITDSVPGILYVYDLEERRNVYSNENITTYLGYTPQEVYQMGSNLLSIIVDPEDMPKVLAREAIIANNINPDDQDWSLDYQARHADGSCRWFSTHSKPFRRYPDGRIKQTIGVAQDITDRKLMELELQSSQHFLSSMIQAIPGIVYLHDLELNCNIYMNNVGLEFLGYTREQVDELGSDFTKEIIHPEDSPSKDSPAMEDLAKGNINRSEYRLKNAQGEWRWHWKQTMTFKSSPEGVPQQILGVVIDIHDRKIAEAALQNANMELENRVAERTQELWQTNFHLAHEMKEKTKLADTLSQREGIFRAIFEQAAVGINMATRDGRIVKVNQKMCQMLGYTEAELLSMTWMEATAPKFLPGAFEYTIKRHKEEINIDNFEKQVVCKDGSLLWVSVTVSFWRDPVTDIGYDFAITQDISDRKQVEFALRESEARFQRMVANIPGMVYQFRADLQGNYQCSYVNHYAQELYEISPPELIEDASKMINLTHPEDIQKQYESITTSFNTLQPWHWLGRIITPSGKLKWLEGNSRPEKQANGDVIWDGIVMDVTDRKVIEAQMQANLQEKELLLREIHHRVKNNLQVISSLLTLQSHNVTDQNILALFQDSQTRIYAIALIHEQLYKTTDFEQINFADYIKNLIDYLYKLYISPQNLIQMQTNIEEIFINLETAIPCGLIISELVINALKYAFPQSILGQVITIELQRLNNQQLALSVKDNGIGIPKDYNLAEINTLGLRLVKMLTQQLEGEITLTCDPGTQFVIIFRELKYSQRLYVPKDI